MHSQLCCIKIRECIFSVFFHGGVIHIFTTNILTSRKGITNIKKGITNIRGRVTSDATDISGKHWQQTLANNGVLRRMLGRSYKHCGKLGSKIKTDKI